MRIVLLAGSGRRLSGLGSACVAAGHTVLAHVGARSMRSRGATGPRLLAAAAEIVSAAPAGVDVMLPGSTAGMAQALSGYRPDLLLCSGFPWKLPREVLGVPRLGAVNIHASLLPRYRGPLPVHWAIRNGDPEMGVTVHWMDDDFDTGPVIIRRGGIPLDDNVVAQRVWQRVDHAAADLVGPALERIAAGHACERQDDGSASYAGLMEPGFLVIRWGQQTVREVHNQVRTFRLGIPGARGPLGKVGDGWMVVLATRTEPGDGLRIRCADGPIWIVDSVPLPAQAPGSPSTG